MLAYLYVMFAVVLRFLPPQHVLPFHFMPVGASLLYFGARRPAREMWAPFLLMAAGDLALNRFVYHLPFGGDQFASWLWYLGAIGLGLLIRNKTSVARLAGASVALSVSFFVISNFAVWASGSMYPMTWPGLMTCYTLAVPFFRNTLIGDAVFTAVLFGAPALLHAARPQTAEA